MNNIIIKDNLSVNDKLGPKGLVRLLKDNIVITDENSVEGWWGNMVLASGRELSIQRLFNKYHQSSSIGDLTEYSVKGFGIGKGGAIDDGMTWSPISPNLGDIGLYDSIPINSNCVSAVDNSNTLQTNVVKLIESQGPANVAGDIEVISSENIEFSGLPNTYYPVAKCTCIIDSLEPTYLNSGESVKISEAMLFSLSPTNTNPIPFAHVSFAPKYIELESQYTIEWYILS